MTVLVSRTPARSGIDAVVADWRTHSCEAAIVLDDVEKQFRNCLKLEEVRTALCRPSGAAASEVWREAPFSLVREGRNGLELISGRFDRVVVTRDAAGKALEAMIVDYKSNRIDEELIFNRFSFHGVPARPINAAIWKNLIRAVVNQRVTRIEYASPRSSQPKEHIIHPLHLANIEGDWYVLAFETRWEDIAQFAVSRIKMAELKQATFVPPSTFDVETLMKDRFGKFIHTDGGKRILVRLLFNPEIASSISERIWHPGQVLKYRQNGSVELTIPVLDLMDILPWVLSFGGDVAVLTPAVLARLCLKARRSGVSTCL